MGAGRFRRDARRHQSGHDAQDRHRPEVRQGRNPPCDRGRAEGVRKLEEDHGCRALEDAAQAARPDPREPGRAGRAADDGAGQVARRSQGRGRHLGRLCALVRGRGQAHLWRHHSVALGRPPPHGHQGAGRRHRRHHAVEFPVLDARPQDRPGARGRLHGGREARFADALFGSSAPTASSCRRASTTRSSRS